MLGQLTFTKIYFDHFIHDQTFGGHFSRWLSNLRASLENSFAMFIKKACSDVNLLCNWWLFRSFGNYFALWPFRSFSNYFSVWLFRYLAIILLNDFFVIWQLFCYMTFSFFWQLFRCMTFFFFWQLFRSMTFSFFWQLFCSMTFSFFWQLFWSMTFSFFWQLFCSMTFSFWQWFRSNNSQKALHNHSTNLQYPLLWTLPDQHS